MKPALAKHLLLALALFVTVPRAYADAFVTPDLNFHIPWLQYTTPAGTQFFWGSLRHSPSADGGIYFEVENYGSYTGTTPNLAYAVVLNENLDLNVPAVIYQQGDKNLLLSGNLVFAPGPNGELRFKVADYKVLGDAPAGGPSGVVAGGFATPLVGATVEFYDAGGELIARYENITDAQGRYDLPFINTSLQNLAYVKAYGGTINGVPYRGEVMAACSLANLSTCHITPYSSVTARLAALYSDVRSADRTSKGENLIQQTVYLDRDPSIEVIPNLDQLIDLQQWDVTHGDGSDIAAWYDRVAADLADGYLDDEDLRKVLIAGKRRPNFKLSVFGQGEVRSHDSSIVLDTRTDPTAKTFHEAQLAHDTAIALTATPADGYQILYWSGCNSVSDDKTRCALRFNNDSAVVGVTFGAITPEVVPNVFDLTKAVHSANGAIYTLTADAADSAMQQTLAGIKAGDYIVSVRDGGFLRKVTAVQALGGNQYQFTTAPALLQEVIKRGTFAYRDPLQMDEIAGIEVYDAFAPPTQARSTSRQAQNEAAVKYLQQLPPGSDEVIMTSTPGVYLKRGAEPDELTLIFGAPESGRQARSLNTERVETLDFVIYDKDKDDSTTDDQLRVRGQLSFKIAIDFGMNFWGANSIKLIAESDTKQNLTFEGDFSGLFSNPDLVSTFNVTKVENGKQVAEIKMFGIPLKPITFSIGPVPVYMEPQINLNAKIGLDNKAGIKTSLAFELVQHIKAGFEYTEGAVDPWNWIGAFNHNEKVEFKPVEVTAEIAPGLGIEAGIKLYKAIDLLIYGNGGMKFNLTATTNNDGLSLDTTCPVKLDAKIYGEADVGFKFKAGIDPEIIFLGELASFSVERSIPIYKQQWPFFAAQALIGPSSECGWQSPSKLSVEGPAIQKNLDFTTGHSILNYHYTVTNAGSQDLDWSVKLNRPDDNVQLIGQDGSATTEIRELGLKKDQTYQFSVRVTSANLEATGSDALGDQLLAFVTRGISTAVTSFFSPTYYNSVLLTNDTDKTTFPAWYTDEAKGNTKIPVEIKLPVPPLSAAPTLVSATAQSSDSVELQWQYTDPVNLIRTRGFTVYTDNLATGIETEQDYYGMISLESGTTHTHTVSGLTPDTQYDFSVEAFGENTWSPLSNIIQVRTPALGADVPAPANFTAVAGDAKATLSWDAVNGAASYVVKGTDAAGNSATAPTSATSYTVSGLTNGQTYRFQVQAVNAQGVAGTYSAEVSVTPLGQTQPPPVSGTSNLNDTGLTWGGSYPSGNNTTCTGETISQQDCSHGRDADPATNSDADGHAGFSFTKVDNGNCVQDNVTGLMWEVKTDDGGLHDKDDTYTWYDTNAATNGGADGSTGESATCYGYQAGNPTTYCNTQAYVARVNATGWCGYTDWQMPNREELRSIVVYSALKPAIDTNFFPNTQSNFYWSGTSEANNSNNSRYMGFIYGYDGDDNRESNLYIRLVRKAQ